MRKACRLVLLSVVSVVSAATHAAAYEQAAIVRSGDPVPGGGGSFDVFYGSYGPGAGSEVAFTASVAGGAALYGVFLAAPGLEALALEGEPAPGTGGGTISDFSGAALDDLGRVVFTGVVSGGSVTTGLFRYDAGTMTALVLEGETAPDTGGGGFAGFLGNIAANASGEAVFYAAVTGGTTTQGIFVHSSGAVRAVAIAGDTAPGGGNFTSFEDLPSLNAAGDVAFAGDVDGVPGDGIFVESGGILRAVARRGESAPGSGGSYDQLLSPDLNDVGDLAFQATLDSESPSAGLFAEVAGSVEPVVLSDDPAPGAGTFVSAGPPELTAGGDVVYHGIVLDGSTPHWGIFRASQGAAAVPVLGAAGLLAAGASLLAAGARAGRRTCANRAPRPT